MLRFGMANQKESAAMKCLRIYAAPDGGSHFDEVELPTTKRSVHPDAVPFEVSASYQASRVRFTRIPAGTRTVKNHCVSWRNLENVILSMIGAIEVSWHGTDGKVVDRP
jgi:hypothetical protein